MASTPPSDQCDSSVCTCDEPEPLEVKTPVKKKSSENNTPTPGKRKASNTPMTARKVSGPAKQTTPIRKASAQNAKTPNSAPARAKTSTRKPPEPTLLTDFLLGRPSPARLAAARRKSLDLVKAEMKESNVRGVQQPGKVQERVKQWQKNGAAIAKADPNLDEVMVTYNTESDEGPDEEERLRVKFRRKQQSKSPAPQKQSPGKPKQTEHTPTPAKAPKDDETKGRSKNAAPPKRVISDSHWMKKKKSPPKKTSGIPKNFLQATAINPPVERKIEDWVRRTTETSVTPEKIASPKRKPRNLINEEGEQPKRSRPSRSPHGDGFRVGGSRDATRDEKTRPKSTHDKSQAEDSSWVTSSRGGSNDDGIRDKPSEPCDDGIRVKHLGRGITDDGIRVRPLGDSLVHEDVHVKQLRKDGSKRRPKDTNETPTPTPRKKSEQHKPAAEPKGSTSSDELSKAEEEGNHSSASPSPVGKSKRKDRKSRGIDTKESLEEIPFGNSAFSVLDLPLGAEAGTLKRPPPKRNPSFGVPRVLKKVYSEGMKIMQDNHDPPRGGPNQPTSIDSWLNNTSDPFVEGSVVSELSLEVPSSHPGRKPSYQEENKPARALSGTHREDRDASERSPRPPKVSIEEVAPKVNTPENSRDTLPSMESSSPTAGGLKRTLATHKASSPKAGRRLFSKDAIFDAFKGESAMSKKKESTPSPFDYIGLRELDVNSVAPLASSNDARPVEQEPQRRVSESTPLVEPVRNSISSFPRRPGPMTGANRLSTIASVATFDSSSSLTTTSNVSQTTVTQDTQLCAITPSLSIKSDKPRRKRSSAKTVERSKVGSKKGLTKHSDLLSMLSLPDTTQPGRSNSIRPARSVRTTRVHLETATVQDIMREVAEDETKYMRELNTLVDGVIPVLLTCVLSKNDAAIAAGLFNPLAAPARTDLITKPIVDMGVALERLKSLHKRIPIADSEDFLHWAQSAHKTYRDYLVAWRTGFQDVVINLEPASPSASPPNERTEMKRDSNGDVIHDNGERVDVAYLLKRPLVRVKNIARATKGLSLIKKSKLTEEVSNKWADNESFARIRAKEEAGRREDLDAAYTDATLARDPRTMAPVEHVTIDPTMQVIAKDTFFFDLHHSSGQRMECQVELILRNSVDRSTSDLLICAFESTHRYLLFPPIAKSCISARQGETGQELAIMIRGVDAKDYWQEIIKLSCEDEEAPEYWIKELGTVPLVPELLQAPASKSQETIAQLEKAIDLVLDDIPIGQRKHHPDEDVTSTERLPSHLRKGPVNHACELLGQGKFDSLTRYNVLDCEELNNALKAAGFAAVKKVKTLGPSPTKRAIPSRYHKQSDSTKNLVVIDVTGDPKFVVEMSGALDLSEQRPVSSSSGGSDRSSYESMELPYMPKKRASSTSSIADNLSTPLRGSMRPEFRGAEKVQANTSSHGDAPPPVPAHRSPSTPDALKKIPVIETPTPRNKNRRGSSPLKHEYQPSESDASGTSSNEESNDSTDSSGSYSDSSDDELEAIDEELDVPAELPPMPNFGRKRSHDGSIYSVAAESLAPSNSASQGPYIPRVPSNGSTNDPLAGDVKKFLATISFWNPNKGKWEDVFPRPDQVCSIHVTPGLVQAFEIETEPVSPNRNAGKEEKRKRPLVALGLTPIVSLRQSTMIDIEINSPPLVSSRLKNSSMVRFRAINDRECTAFYQAVHRSRLENPTWKKLETDRMLAAYGHQAYDKAVAPSRRNWFGRKKSYRALARATSEADISEDGSKSPSALSALARLRRGGGGIFNIDKSSIHDRRRNPSDPTSGPNSNYTTESSEYSGATSPRSPSVAYSGSMYSNGLAIRDIGSENLRIRLYRGATSSKWQDMGEALLTVSTPLPGMRHASSLNHGISKRITVTSATSSDDTEEFDNDGTPTGRNKRRSSLSFPAAPIPSSQTHPRDPQSSSAVVWLDVILGSRNFMRYGRNGIAFEIWEDIRGDDGMLGGVPATGGVSGRTRKWMFQTQRAGDCVWIYGLVGGS